MKLLPRTYSIKNISVHILWYKRVGSNSPWIVIYASMIRLIIAGCRLFAYLTRDDTNNQRPVHTSKCIWNLIADELNDGKFGRNSKTCTHDRLNIHQLKSGFKPRIFYFFSNIIIIPTIAYKMHMILANEFFFRLLDVIKRLFNNQIWNDEIIIMIFPFWMSSMSFCLCAVFTFEKNHMIKKKKIILCLTVIWAN